MLTADHVYARRRGDLLSIDPLTSERRARALEIAAALIDVARAHVGVDRGSFTEACRAIPYTPTDRKAFLGLSKLVADRLSFEEETSVEPVALRDELFSAATVARRELPPGRRFDRSEIVNAVAARRAVAPAAIESALFADLPSAHVMRQAVLPAPERLVALFEAGQIQAVLLRAVAITAEIREAAPAALRALFRWLKFHQLLFTIEPLTDGSSRGPRPGYRLNIDGPYSLFEQITRYGLKLALALPHLLACGTCQIEAQIRWGKSRAPLRFKTATLPAPAPGDETGGSGPPSDDALATLVTQCNDLVGTPFVAAPAAVILDLPGVGVCIPDIVFTHRETGTQIFYEQLGFWSRDAVWRRVELIERGLSQSVIFGVARHLRVSEKALEGDSSSALYVFARTPRALALLDLVKQVALTRARA